ncbi:MAG: helix-turn-helix domain-containing protein [Thermoguttaceae bacterium]|jgi:HTH-type transcriptional regulator/antitoxin HigA
MATLNRREDAPEHYLELVARFPLRPIRSDEELEGAVRMVDSLLDRRNLAPEEEDYLEVLGDLIERYEDEAHPMAPVSDSDTETDGGRDEDEAHPMAPVSDAEMLRHLIEAKGVSHTEIARDTGMADSTISEILKGKRTLNRSHIGKLARYFNVSPGVFAF